MRNSRKGRFRVWDRSQDSFNGEDLVYNFDNLDELIGGPNGVSGASGNEYAGTASAWLGYGDSIPSLASQAKLPGTTNSGYEVQSGRRTLYSIASGLNYNDVPLGTVITWWRPNSNIAIPDGWVPCDGRQVAADQHSYPLAGIITVPDLRNKFVIGADSATPGINAFGGYSLESGATPAQNINAYWSGTPANPGSTGAPGVGYDSGLEDPSARTGSNTERDVGHTHGAGTLSIQDHEHSIDHQHIVPAHAHKIVPHSHDMTHVHLMPNHVHNLNGVGTNQNFRSGDTSSSVSVREGLSQNYKNVAGRDHTHPVSIGKAGQTGDRDPINQNAVAAKAGLFEIASTSKLWGLPPDPYTTNSAGMGYQFQAITSYPTYRQHNGNILNAHVVREQTGIYSPEWGSQELNTALNGSLNSGEITTKKPIGNGRSGGIVSGNATKTLTGVTQKTDLLVNIRPQYVGLLYLIKVRVSTNII